MLGYLLAMILIVCAFLVLLSVFIYRYTDFCFKALFASPLAQVNQILVAGKVPDNWRLKGLESLIGRNPQKLSCRAMHKLLCRWYAIRLGRLAHQVSTNSFIPERDKREILEILRSIRTELLD